MNKSIKNWWGDAKSCSQTSTGDWSLGVALHDLLLCEIWIWISCQKNQRQMCQNKSSLTVLKVQVALRAFEVDRWHFRPSQIQERGQSGEKESDRIFSGQACLVSLMVDANDYFLHLERIKEKILSYSAAKQSYDNLVHGKPCSQIENE